MLMSNNLLTVPLPLLSSLSLLSLLRPRNDQQLSECILNMKFPFVRAVVIVLSIIIIDAVTTIDAVVVLVVIGLLMVWRNDICSSSVSLWPLRYITVVPSSLRNNIVNTNLLGPSLSLSLFPLNIWHPVSFFKWFRYVALDVHSILVIDRKAKHCWFPRCHWLSHFPLTLFNRSIVCSLFGNLTKSQNHIVVKLKQTFLALDSLEPMCTILYFFLFRTILIDLFVFFPSQK